MRECLPIVSDGVEALVVYVTRSLTMVSVTFAYHENPFSLYESRVRRKIKESTTAEKHQSLSFSSIILTSLLSCETPRLHVLVLGATHCMLSARKLFYFLGYRPPVASLPFFGSRSHQSLRLYSRNSHAALCTISPRELPFGKQ
jgi:hypothetical protein